MKIYYETIKSINRFAERTIMWKKSVKKIIFYEFTKKPVFYKDSYVYEAEKKTFSNEMLKGPTINQSDKFFNAFFSFCRNIY